MDSEYFFSARRNISCHRIRPLGLIFVYLEEDYGQIALGSAELYLVVCGFGVQTHVHVKSCFSNTFTHIFGVYDTEKLCLSAPKEPSTLGIAMSRL